MIVKCIIQFLFVIAAVTLFF